MPQLRKKPPCCKQVCKGIFLINVRMPSPLEAVPALSKVVLRSRRKQAELAI